MYKNIEEIIKKNDYFIFVSPHLDDAALSCGQLITEIVKRQKKVTVISVFTMAHRGPYTLSARKYLANSGGYRDASKLYQARIIEDEDALSLIKVSKRINLGLEDALFRRKKISTFGKYIPELDHIYPTYRLHVAKNKINSADNSKDKLAIKLKKYVGEKTTVFAPYNAGGHVDHQIVREVCEELFPSVILYSDFPYNIRNKHYGNKSDKRKFILKPDIKKKEKIIRMYKSQFEGLFPSGKFPTHNEVYFIKK